LVASSELVLDSFAQLRAARRRCGEPKSVSATIQGPRTLFVGAFLILFALTGSRAQAADLKLVQTGEVAMSSASRSVTLATAVDPSRSFVVCTSRADSSRPNRRATCELGSGSSTTSLTVTAGTSDSSTVVRWYVAEFASGVTVRRGTSTFSSGALTPSSAPSFSAVTVARSFVILSERTNESSSGTDEQWNVRARLSGTTATTLELTRLQGGVSGTALTVAWQVVQMDGASVQRGTTCIGGSTACPGSNGATVSATLATAVDTSTSFVLITRRGGTSIDGIDNRLAVRAGFSSAGPNVTGLTFTRAIASTDTNQRVDIAYEVVALNDGGVVTRGTAGPSGASSTQLTGNPGTAPGQSVPFITVSGGSSTQTGELDDLSWTAFIASSSLIRFDRDGSDVASAATVGWQAVQFVKCSGLANVTGVSGVGTSVNGTARIGYSSSPVLILRKASPFTPGDAPVNGVQYAVGQTVGGATVVKTDASPTTAFEQGGLAASTTVYYKVFARAGASCYASGSTSTEVAIRTSGGRTAWVYSNPSGVTLNAPVASYGPTGIETALISTAGGSLIAADIETGVPRYAPVATAGGIHTYGIGIPLSGSGEEKVFVGDDTGRVYRIDAATGNVDWTAGPFPGVDGIRAAITVQHYETAEWFGAGAAFRGAAFQSPTPTDVVFVASHNGAGCRNNRILALRADTGALLWTFNASEAFDMDVVVGQPWIDYETNALYVVTRADGYEKSYWVLDSVTGALRGARKYGDFALSAVNMGYDPDTMTGTTIYLGNSTGQVIAVDPVDHDVRWYFQVPSWAATNGYVSQDWTTGNIYFSTTDGHVWALDKNGQKIWKTASPVPGVSTVLVLPADAGETVAGVYVGSSDGKLRRFTLAGNGAGAATLASAAFGVGDPAIDKTLGEPTTFDDTALLIGTDEGKVYKITLPLP
jgi:outer membrane protein assembly factor BamB